MSSLLRCSKFIKIFTGVSRNITLSAVKNDIPIQTQHSKILCNTIRCLATQSFVPKSQNESALERSLRRIDMDVRRSGRVSRKELEEVLGEMKHSRSATSSQSLLLIRCCGNLVPEEQPEVRTKLVQEIWKTIESLGIQLDISHYNALLRVYLENEHEFSPVDFLKDLEMKGVEPNRVTYQRLIAHYCRKGDIDGATQILQFMKEKQIPVNEGVFNSLVMGHSQCGDMESALGILKVMDQGGLSPTAETYATLLCGYAKSGDMESIRKVLNDCEAKQLDIIDRDFMDILFVSVVNGHTEPVDELLGRMRRVAGYNQDAVNLILKLINIEREDIAYKVLLTMPRPVRTDGEQIPTGNFFLRQLIKAKRPMDKVLYYCNELKKNEMNSNAHLVALEACLTLTKIPEQAYALMNALNDSGYPPRTHFFWPLLASLGQKNDIDGMMQVLSKMFEMKIVPGAETLRDYVVPYLIKNELKLHRRVNPDSAISMMRGCGVSTASAANAVVSCLVTQNKLKEAADVAVRHRARYSSLTLQRPMTLALNATMDVDSYVQILSKIVAGFQQRTSSAVEDDDAEEADALPASAGGNSAGGGDVSRRVVGSFLADFCFGVPKDRSKVLESLMNALLSKGLGISSFHAEVLQERLGSEMTPELSALLGKLTSEDLVPVDISFDQELRPALLEGKDLENLLAVQEAKGNPTKGLKRQLLGYYCRNKNLEEAERLIKELEADEDFTFTEALYAQIMDLYASCDKLEEALAYRKKVMEMNPTAVIEDFKVMKLVESLLKVNRVEDALKIISEQPADRKIETRSFGYNACCWRLLNVLAEAGKVEELESIFNALVKSNLIEPTNILMGPLIKVHLEKNDIEGAMKKFEWCCENNGATPYKNQLACKLIEAEDAVSLQRLTDLSTRVHGEVNSLYDLVFSFVECGRVRQARKILETPGLRNRPNRLTSACRRYYEEGMVAPLEGLVEATKDLTHIDRSEIYLSLLNSYTKANNPNKALGLWMQMQDEDVQPSDEFLLTLAKLLRSNDMKVPFVEPSPVPSLSVQGKAITQSEKNQKKVVEAEGTSKSPTIQRFRQAIRIGDTDTALQCKSRLEAEGKQMPVTELSLLVELLVRNNRIGEATAIVETYHTPEVRQDQRMISPRVLRFFLNRLANLGDLDSFTNIGNLLSQEEKRIISFDNRFCNAYIVSGKAEDYLNILSKQIDEAKDEDLESIQETFPRGGAIGILQNHPELLPKYEEIARKYAARKIVSPLNVLWAHYFSTEGKEPEANAIWKEHLCNSPRVMFQLVCQRAKAKKDTALIQRLFDTIKDSPVSDAAKGSVHASLIEIYASEDKHDEALKALGDAVKDVSLDNIPKGCLHRLKRKVELQGKSFPYTIPEKQSKSSSSSSSDDEPDEKKSK